MIPALLLLLLCQLGGEVLVRVSDAPIPGPVIGLVLMLLLVALRRETETLVGPTADGLLRNLSLLFVPAGVGIVQHLDRLERELVPIMAALVLSTMLAIIVTALVFSWTSRLARHNGDDGEHDGTSFGEDNGASHRAGPTQ